MKMGNLDIGANWEELVTDPNLVHMGHNCNYLLEYDPRIKEAMIHAIADEAYRNYAPPFGYERLRELVATDLGCPGCEVVIGQGGTDAIYQTLASVLRPGDEVICSDPGWPHIPLVCSWLGATPVFVPIYNESVAYKLLPELIGERIGPRTRVIAIVDPLNPLGSCYSQDEIKAICRLAEERGIYILHDTTYRDFADGENYPAVRYYGRAITTMSLSKNAAFAGLRLGAALAQPKLFAEVTRRHVSRFGTNIVAQRGAIAALETKSSWLPLLLQANRRNQSLIKECVAGLHGVHLVVDPSHANFVAVDVSGHRKNPEEIVDQALAEGFVIRSGAYTSRAYKDKFIRVTTTVPTAHVARFSRALEKILS